MRVCLSNELAEMFHACRKVAEQEDTAAHYAFGLKFYYGEEVPQKDIQAHLWWNLAANAGAEWDQELKDKAYDSISAYRVRSTLCLSVQGHCSNTSAMRQNIKPSTRAMNSLVNMISTGSLQGTAEA